MKKLMKDCYCFVLMYKDCWHHLRNVWFDSVIKKIGAHLDELLEENLEEIHYSLRVTTEIANSLCAIEKYFCGTANYVKGKGSVFMYYMRRYHPTAYLYPGSRACGGLLQDIGIAGEVTVLMNIPHYLDFLIWKMSCGGDGILEKTFISFCGQLKWCHSYVSFLSCTSLSIYLYDGLPETAATSESMVLELHIFQRPWN